MSDDSEPWRIDLHPPHANATEEQVLECFSRAWATQAARVLRNQLDASSIQGSASAKMVLGELIALVYQLLVHELVQKHCDSPRVLSLFRRVDDQTQTVPRDERGRISESRARRVG